MAKKKKIAKKTVKKTVHKASKKKSKTGAKKVAKKKATKNAKKSTNTSKLKTKKVDAPKPKSSLKMVSAVEKVGSPPVKQLKVKKMTKAQMEADKNKQALVKKWVQLQAKSKQRKLKAKDYSMKASFETKTPISHDILGWGFILNNTNGRLEVLFESGVKHLISNYK